MYAPRMFLNKNAKRWLEVLRSGKFKQANGSLREEIGEAKDGTPLYSYCALGVAMKVAEEEAGMKFADYEWDNGELPPRVTTWLGLKENDGSFEVLNSFVNQGKTIKAGKDLSIPEINDGYGNKPDMSLKRIAKVVHMNASSMFTRVFKFNQRQDQR